MSVHVEAELPDVIELGGPRIKSSDILYLKLVGKRLQATDRAEPDAGGDVVGVRATAHHAAKEMSTSER